MRNSTPIIAGPLRGRIIVLLVAKLVALTVLYWLFFGSAHQPNADSAATATQILGQPSAQLNKEE